MFTRKKKSKKKKIIVSITIGVLAIIFGVLLYSYMLISKINNVKINKENLGINKEVEKTDNNIKNIALFAIDSKENKKSSDIIVILTLDESKGKTKITYIMKDSYVNIPGKGMEKINNAYSAGGPELAIKTINENFALNISQFLSIDFSGFEAIIDGLGGVQIKITDEEVKYISDLSSSGVKNLTGKQALEYLKIKDENEEETKKNQRQRNIIEALYEAYKYTSIKKYPKIVSSFLPHVTTNISLKEIISYGENISKSVNAGIKQDKFPREGEWEEIKIKDKSYLKYDLEKAKKDIQSYIFDKE